MLCLRFAHVFYYSIVQEQSMYNTSARNSKLSHSFRPPFNPRLKPLIPVKISSADLIHNVDEANSSGKIHIWFVFSLFPSKVLSIFLGIWTLGEENWLWMEIFTHWLLFYLQSFSFFQKSIGWYRHIFNSWSADGTSWGTMRYTYRTHFYLHFSY